MSHPFAEFFVLLEQAGIPVNLRDYYRLHQALSSDGDWTAVRLERVLVALLANDVLQGKLIRTIFRENFDTRWQEVLAPEHQGKADIAACRVALLQLIADTPDSPEVAFDWQPLPAPVTPQPELSPHPKPVSFFKKYCVLLVGLLLVVLLGAGWLLLLSSVLTPEPIQQSQPVDPLNREVVTITPTPATSGQPIMVDVNVPDPEKVQSAEQARATQLTWWGWLSALLAALSAGLFAYWRWQNRPPEVKLLKSAVDAEIKQDFFDDSRLGGLNAAWLSHRDIDQIAEQLDYINTNELTNELAVDDSIRETIVAGFSQLRFAVKQTIQPVLILVDLTPRQQRWHTMAEEMATGLRARGVRATLGYCRQNFDYFVDASLEEHALNEWHEGHPDARLFIFLDTQANPAIEAFKGKDWAQWAVFTLRDRLQWDYREAQLTEKRLPLYPATASGLMQAMRSKVVPPVFTVSHNQSFELCRHHESDKDYCRRVLGGALGLAQALSSYPRSWSLAAADVLRQAHFLQVERLHLQRLLRLCDTGMGDSFRFEPRWQAVLVAGYEAQPEVRQQAIRATWLKLLEGCEPKDKDSNAWAGWRWRKSLLCWNDDPDAETEVVAGLLQDYPDFSQTIQEQSSRWVEQPEASPQTPKALPRSRKGKRLFKQLLVPEGVNDYSQKYLKEWQPQWALLVSVAALLLTGGMWYQTVSAPLVAATLVQQEALLTPEMVNIPAGDFIMGCEEGVDDAGDLRCYDPEKPSHPVKVSAFQMGQYEVTHDKYVQFLNAVGRRGEKGKEWFETKAEDESGHIIAEQGRYKVEEGFESHPVINVSWYGAQAYIAWLNQVDKAGGWRLPSEAEWEYAARGNTEPRTAFFWGNAIGENNANCWNDTCKDKYAETAPVGSFTQNEHPFGLFDMHGNVWEWVEDCWVGDYKAAKKDKDGTALTDCGTGVSRVLRGGSWDNFFPDYLRSAYRFNYDPAFRNINVGFRLARTISPLSAPESESSPVKQEQSVNGSGGGAVATNPAQQVAPVPVVGGLIIEMVDIPAGDFMMGCVEGVDDAGDLSCYDWEKPAHPVSVEAFQMATTEVTVTQFRAFVAATNYRTTAETEGSCWSYDKDGNYADVKGNNWLKPGFAQEDAHPVVCISWNDAQAYIDWLNKQVVGGVTGGWRLPSEAEWEYTARGNTEPRTAFFWGNVIGENNANCRNDTCKDKYAETAPVGSFTQNEHPFGLFDMHGNVWEWVEDCWVGDYKAAKKDKDGTALTDCGTGVSRVLRGGSWHSYPDILRSAFRNNLDPSYRNFNVGFRLARTR